MCGTLKNIYRNLRRRGGRSGAAGVIASWNLAGVTIH